MIIKDGQGRIEFLREIVNDGEQATALLKFMNKYKEETEKDTLEKLKTETDKDKIAEIIADYKAVTRFCDTLQYASDLGARKEKALEKELKKQPK